MTPVQVAQLAVALACWVMTAIKIAHLVHRLRDRPLIFMCLTQTAITLALTVQPIAPQLDQALGVLGVSRALGNCLALVAVAAGHALIILLTAQDPAALRQVRHDLALAAASVAAIVAVFPLAPAPYDLADHYVRSIAYYTATPTPAEAPHTVLYLICLGWWVVHLAIAATRYARIASRPLLAVGTRLIAAGVLIGLAYVVAKLAAMIAASVGASTVVLDQLVLALYVVAILTVLIGGTVPAWGPRAGVDRLLDSLLARRDCRRLRPLWQIMHDAVPQIALRPRPVEPRLRRIRLTVEILDGYVLLSPWMSAGAEQEVRRHASGRPDPEAAVAARMLTLAISLKRAGRPPVDDPAAIRSFVDAAPGEHQANAAAQVQWLARIARVMRRQAGIRVRQPP
ncbi:MAB_1171c family putative transporter [Nonomuraea sp. NPDC050540]|uniref:MAB_1171c family putative transporter n=1 Tax=Nonomuraea sp. NPDC050540 TaxID=3364367 RepID=UPI0037A6B92D